MLNLNKYLTLRLLALLMFPYSASAAAACSTQLEYDADNGPDLAYESAAYRVGSVSLGNACDFKNGIAAEAQPGNDEITSLVNLNETSL